MLWCAFIPQVDVGGRIAGMLHQAIGNVRDVFELYFVRCAANSESLKTMASRATSPF